MRRITVLLAAVILAVAGCNGDSQAEESEKSERSQLRALSLAELELALLTHDNLDPASELEFSASTAEENSSGDDLLGGLTSDGSPISGFDDGLAVDPESCTDYYEKWINPFEGEDVENPGAEAGIAFSNEERKTGLVEMVRSYSSEHPPNQVNFYREHVERCPEIEESNSDGSVRLTMETSSLDLEGLGDNSYGIRFVVIAHADALSEEPFISLSVDSVVIDRGSYQIELVALGEPDSPFDEDELAKYAKLAIDRLDAVLDGELVAEEQQTPDVVEEDQETAVEVDPEVQDQVKRVFLMYINDPSSSGTCDILAADPNQLHAEVGGFMAYYITHGENGSQATAEHFEAASLLLREFCGLAG